MKSDFTSKELENQILKQVRIFVWTRDMGNNHQCRCCSCGQLKYADELEVGHFVKRGKNLKLKYDLRNNHLQCIYCNRFRKESEMLKGYAEFLDKKYGYVGGITFSEYLILESNFDGKMMRIEKIELLDELKQKNKQNKRLIDLL